MARGLRIGYSGFPLWRQGAALNEWMEISGTSGAGGALLNAFSGFDVVPPGLIVAGAAGGHGTGAINNKVVSLDLMTDEPSWVERVASSATAHNTSSSSAYEDDGKPKARHTYHSIIAMPALGRVMLFGVRYDLEQNTHDAVDGIDIANWVWDPAGTYANCSPSGYYGVVRDGDGNVWCILHSSGSVAKYTAATNTWSSPSVTGAVAANVRYPWAWDGTRGQLFGLAWGDGEGSGTSMRAVRMVGTTQAAITFSPGSSAAVAQFAADAPQYAGMDYDQANGRFLFLSASAPDRIYVVTPNGGTQWDMGLLSIGGGSAPLPGTTSLVLSKFRYVAALGGFVLLPDADGNLFFMRTS